MELQAELQAERRLASEAAALRYRLQEEVAAREAAAAEAAAAWEEVASVRREFEALRSDGLQACCYREVPAVDDV